jgi:hypothetical protein
VKVHAFIVGGNIRLSMWQKKRKQQGTSANFSFFFIFLECRLRAAAENVSYFNQFALTQRIYRIKISFYMSSNTILQFFPFHLTIQIDFESFF